jgi:hypothetical protein
MRLATSGAARGHCQGPIMYRFGRAAPRSGAAITWWPADADHSSFGCRDPAQWTYFGDAFFNTAMLRESEGRLYPGTGIGV